MTENPIINDKELFEEVASDFLHTLFNYSLENGNGEIEIRTFSKKSKHKQSFYNSVDSAVEKAYNLCNERIDVYMGVNPRVKKGGKKENIKYLTTFHAEIDYGGIGHKKKPLYETTGEAFEGIKKFKYQPTVVNHSGGGFHCYWVLSKPVKVEDVSIEVLENINKSLSLKLGGDIGTHDIPRVLRIPGTYNFKQEDNPRGVTVVMNSGPKYKLEDFEEFKSFDNPVEKEAPVEKKEELYEKEKVEIREISINNLPISERMKSLIQTGNDGSYPSRSEAEFAVIVALVSKGVDEAIIEYILKSYSIGEKYREQKNPVRYIKNNIEKAKQMSNLTDKDIENPLITAGALIKSNDKYKLSAVKLADYTSKKFHIKCYKESYFKFNGKCFETMDKKSINKMCQTELNVYRNLFTTSVFTNTGHFIEGDASLDISDDENKNEQYLVFQNCLLNLKNNSITPHNPEIFTLNLLPYNYDPDAKCPRWERFLKEIFLNDSEKIQFVQEAIGYCLHFDLPVPALFFLVGTGSNGKSVLLNTMVNLFGEENICNISLNILKDQFYRIQLNSKMLNLTSETPNSKKIETDLIKDVVDGDWVTGRNIFEKPVKFKPYAKHFFAMNKLPDLNDYSHGMWRRIKVIEFPKTFTENEMDVYLTEKLKKELPGIFNWALEGLNRLKANKFRFTKCSSILKSVEKYKTKNSSILSFISDNLKKVDNEKALLKYGEVFQQYKEYCKEEGYQTPEKKKDFRKVLEDNKFTIVNHNKKGNQYYIINVESRTETS